MFVWTKFSHPIYFTSIKLFQIISVFKFGNIIQLNGLEISTIKWPNISMPFFSYISINKLWFN